MMMSALKSRLFRYIPTDHWPQSGLAPQMRPEAGAKGRWVDHWEDGPNDVQISNDYYIFIYIYSYSSIVDDESCPNTLAGMDWNGGSNCKWLQTWQVSWTAMSEEQFQRIGNGSSLVPSIHWVIMPLWPQQITIIVVLDSALAPCPRIPRWALSKTTFFFGWTSRKSARQKMWGSFLPQD